MIYGSNSKPDPSPIFECPNFNKCSANLCPLDPEIEARPYVLGDDRCVATKPTRISIGTKYPELLPFKGFTRREWSGQIAWAKRDPKEKKRFIASNTKRLKTLKKAK